MRLFEVSDEDMAKSLHTMTQQKMAKKHKTSNKMYLNQLHKQLRLEISCHSEENSYKESKRQPIPAN